MIFLHHVEYLVPSELQAENLKELKGLKRANKGLSTLTPERGGISLGRGVYGAVELLTVDVGFPPGSGRDNLLKDLENVVSLSDSTREGGEEWGLSSSFLDRLEIEKSGDTDATYSVLSRTPTFHSILRRAEREILGTIDEGIADRSSKANSSRSTQNYILWSFAPRSLSSSGSTERFYREVLRIVADSKSQALILRDSVSPVPNLPPAYDFVNHSVISISKCLCFRWNGFRYFNFMAPWYSIPRTRLPICWDITLQR